MSQKKISLDVDAPKPGTRQMPKGLGDDDDVPKPSVGQMSKGTGLDVNVPKASKSETLVEKPKPAFKVITYQIPVPLGDCSAHLLVERGQDGGWVFGEKSSAILMDGGRDSDDIRAGLMISNAIGRIRTDWGDRWQFSAWVITHWDSDHYAGALSLFLRGEGISDTTEEPDAEYGKALTLGESGSADFVKKPRFYAGASIPAKNRSKLHEIGFRGANVMTGKSVIGIDFFTGTRILKEGAGKPIEELETDMPRFCCLAADGYVVGTTSRVKRPSTNETSILSLLYWPKDRHAAYFTGGDGYPKITNDYVIPYLREERFLGDLKGITAVKLDHHGSSKEWTAGIKTGEGFGELPCFNMTLAACPKRVLVTPGNQYGHPCWDVIMCLYAYYHYRRDAEKTTLYSTRVPYWNDSDLFLSTKDMNITQKRIELALAQFNSTFKEINNHPLYKEHPKELGEDFVILGGIFASHREAMAAAEKERRQLGKKIYGSDWIRDGDEGIVREDAPVPTKEELEKLRKELDKADMEPTKPTKMVVEEHRPTELDMAGDRIWRAPKDLATITSLWWDWLSPQQLSSTYGEQGPYILLKLESTNDETDGTMTMLKADGSGKADFSHIPKREMPVRGGTKVNYEEVLKKLQENLEKMRAEEATKAEKAIKVTGKDELGQHRDMLKDFYEKLDLSEGITEDGDYEMEGEGEMEVEDEMYEAEL